MNWQRWIPTVSMAVLTFVVSMVLGWFVADFRLGPTVAGFFWVGVLTLIVAVTALLTLKELIVALTGSD